MTRDPQVSVCLLAYQHGQWVGQAIEGVLRQETTFGVEIVIGVDESTDDTLDVCLAHQEKHPDRIRVERRDPKDRVYVGGRPTGRFNLQQTLHACRAPFVAMLDGDDWWTDPEKLQRQVDLMTRRPDLSMCFHRVMRVDTRTGEQLSVYPRRLTTETVSASQLVPVNLVPMVSVLYRRSAIPDPLPAWFVTQTPIGDWPLHMLVLQSGPAGFLARTMAAYRVGSGWWSTRRRRDVLNDTIATRELVLTHVGGPHARQMAWEIDRRRLQLTQALAEDGLLDEARAELRKVAPESRRRPSPEVVMAALALSSPTLSRGITTAQNVLRTGLRKRLRPGTAT